MNYQSALQRPDGTGTWVDSCVFLEGNSPCRCRCHRRWEAGDGFGHLPDWRGVNYVGWDHAKVISIEIVIEPTLLKRRTTCPEGNQRVFSEKKRLFQMGTSPIIIRSFI